MAAAGLSDLRAKVLVEVEFERRAALGRDFSWGDCALRPADILARATGSDPACEWRGAFRGENEGRALLGARGLYAAVNRAARRHGWKRIDPELARPGDIGLMPSPAGLVCTIFGRAQFIAFIDFGFATLPPRYVRVCYSIES